MVWYPFWFSDLSREEIARLFVAFAVFNIVSFLIIFFIPDLEFFAFLIGLMLAVIAYSVATVLLESYTRNRVEREAREKKAKEKELVQNHLDTNKCLSCSSILPSKARHCPECGFDMSKYR